MNYGSSSSTSSMSTSSSLAPGDRITSVKFSLGGIGFNTQYINQVEYLVNLVNYFFFPKVNEYFMNKMYFSFSLFVLKKRLNQSDKGITCTV